MAEGDVLELAIERMAYGACGVAHDAAGKVVFVSGGLVGDVVRARVTQDGERMAKARAEEVLAPSPDRAEPRCPHADICGGCPWARLSRKAQLAAKRANVVDALTRIGHLPAEHAEALVASCEAPSGGWGYRNKVELAAIRAGGRLSVGMHAATGEGVVRVDACPLLDARRAKLVKAVSGALGYLGGHNDLGISRLAIRAAAHTRDVEVALWGEPGAFPRSQVAKVVGDATHASSVVRVLTKGPAKARRVSKVEVLSGRGCWEERVGEERMCLSAPSFFQVNTAGAERLVELVLAGLAPDEDDEAMDLYCGAGTFTLPLARRAGFVSAVEASGPAVRDLRRNLDRAHLGNVDVVGGDAGREFPDSVADVIVVDPPRAGLAEGVVARLSEQPARTIAYVSCDPATLARDLARFAEHGSFAPERIIPVDLFPQTYHVETLTLLRHQ